MKKKLTKTDKRILQLPGILKSAGLIDYTKDFIQMLGMSKQNYYSIPREANQHFTLAQIQLLCKTYNIDGNWILGLQDEYVFRKITLKPKQLSRSYR